MSESIEERAKRFIDDSWHASWHWERGEEHSLTDKGWAQLYRDCQEKIDELQRRLQGLFDLRDALDTMDIKHSLVDT
jgi:hypothetical protein